MLCSWALRELVRKEMVVGDVYLEKVRRAANEV